MKVYRFLTTLIVILLLGTGTRINAQEITEFELRNSSLHSPFPVAHHFPGSVDLAVDELGRALPINQCKTEYSPARSDRCGFSAGHDDHLVVKPETVAQNEIDLSPLSFDCMNSQGCELEYARSEKEFRNSINESNNFRAALDKEEVRQIIAAVFSNNLSIELDDQALSVDESVYSRPDFEVPNSETYTPYIDPNQLIGTEPTLGQSQLLLADYLALGNFWQQALMDHPILNQPADFISDQLVELECRLCGSPALSLAYSLSESIDAAEKRLAARRQIVKQLAAAKLAELKREREEEIAIVQRNAMIVIGLAKVTRSVGKTLVEVSDSISEISVKKVESISSDGH